MNSMRVLTGIGGGEGKEEYQEKLIKYVYILIHPGNTKRQKRDTSSEVWQESMSGSSSQQHAAETLRTDSKSVPTATIVPCSMMDRSRFHRELAGSRRHAAPGSCGIDGAVSSSRLIINSSPC